MKNPTFREFLSEYFDSLTVEQILYGLKGDGQ